jgi:hypothetical protein
LALIKFPDGFDADMSYQLREKNVATLEDMQKCAISVTIKEEPSMSTTDSKIDSLSRNVEFMMERMNLSDKNPPRDNGPAPQI